jgi:Kef-type K+ transport system membrane component KefB
VWFVHDEFASLKRLQQAQTALAEGRKSRNPIVLGLQSRSQLDATYGQLAGVGAVAWIAAKMALFIVIGGALGLYLVPRVSHRINNLPISRSLITFTFVVTVFYAWSAEVLGGMAAITGAFLAGLAFGRSPLKERIEEGVATLAYGVFVPIFFVNVGLSANARELTADGAWLLIAMVVVAVLSKLLGGGIGARLAGFTNLESIQLGAGLISRGEVGLIVASVGIAEGLIGAEVFSIIVGVVIVTTLLTPLVLRALFAGRPAVQGERL